MIGSYGDQSTTREPSFILLSCFTNCLNCSECFQRHLMFYTCNYNIRVTHRNGAIKHIFYTNQIHGGSSADCSLFILSLHALALHLAVKKYCFKSFCMKIWARCTHIHLSVVPSRMPAGPHFVTQPILLSENIPNIWHKSSTKHKEVRPDWNDKNDNANYSALITWKGFTNGSVAILKKYSIKCERFRLWIVLFWTKTSQRLTLYLLSIQIIFTSCWKR